MKKETDPLVGKFFHTYRGGKIHWQGEVLARVPRTNFYLVQLFEWWLGTPSDQLLVRINSMREWFFVNSANELRERAADVMKKQDLEHT
jgi:hypothetical protein